MSQNSVLLSGIVKRNPTFYIDNDSLRIDLTIDRYDISRIEDVSVYIFDEDVMRKALQEVKAHDYFMMTKGRVISTNFTRTIEKVCPLCQEVITEKRPAERTEIECSDFIVIPHPEERIEGFNKVFLTGNICTTLRFNPHSEDSNRPFLKYKLAVNREGVANNAFQHSTQENKTADFPFIVSFGREAEFANEVLHPTALVQIEGAVQQRMLTATEQCVCEECGTEFEYQDKNVVREILVNKANYITLGQKDKPRQIGIEEYSSEFDTV